MSQFNLQLLFGQYNVCCVSSIGKEETVLIFEESQNNFKIYYTHMFFIVKKSQTEKLHLPMS